MVSSGCGFVVVVICGGCGLPVSDVVVECGLLLTVIGDGWESMEKKQ